ncbi:MAG: hypothetical protein H6684_13250 [Deltaproteobacteria bacterium]|nr:hypothetical protein [Deltaproteobacteria bacterium]
MRDRASSLLIVVPVGAAALGAVYLLTGQWPWVPLAGVILLIGLRDYFLPVRYTVDEHGAHARYVLHTRRRDWSRIKRVVAEANGVFFSPYVAPSRLENHRGLFCRFTDNREAVLAVVARHHTVERAESAARASSEAA